MADESPIQNDNYTAKSVILVSRNQNEPLPVQLEDGKAVVGDSAANSGIAQVLVPVPDGDDTHFLNGDGAWTVPPGGEGTFTAEQLTLSLDTEAAGLTGNDNIEWTDSTGDTASITWSLLAPESVELASGVYVLDSHILFTTDIPSVLSIVVPTLEGVGQVPGLAGLASSIESEVSLISGSRMLVLTAPATLVMNAQINLDAAASIYLTSSIVITRIS